MMSEQKPTKTDLLVKALRREASEGTGHPMLHKPYLLEAADELERLVNTYEAPSKYACHCDLEPHMEPDGCVLDDGSVNDCIYAKGAKERGGKHTCEYWRPVTNAINWKARAEASEEREKKFVELAAKWVAAQGLGSTAEAMRERFPAWLKAEENGRD